MAISRIPGYSLLQDLDRQGVDLQFTTNSQTLAYLDFANYRLGINTISPQEAIHVVGNALIANNILNSANVTHDIGTLDNWWRTVYANNVSATTLSGTLLSGYQPNITTVGTLASLNVTGEITAGNINATITGNIAGILLNGDQPLITNLSNVTITNALITSNLHVYNSLAVNNSVTATSFTQNGNAVLDTNSTINVTGNVSGTGTLASLNLTLSDTGVVPGVYGSTQAIPIIDVDRRGRLTSITTGILNKIGNIAVNDTTLSSNSSITLSTSNNGDITLDANGTGLVKIIGTDSVAIPSGNTLARPASPPIGSVRFNTDINSIEYYDGYEWGSPTHQSVSSQAITPTGTSNVFILNETSTSAGLFVSINGTVQQPDVAYHVVGNVITFTETPQITDSIEIRSLISGAIASKTLQAGNTIIEVYDDSITVAAYGSPAFSVDRSGAVVSAIPSTTVLASTTGVIDVFNKTTYRSAKYVVQSTSITDSETCEVLVTHNSAANAYSITYGIVGTGVSLGNIDSSISGNLVQLTYTASASNVTVKISKNYLTL